MNDEYDVLPSEVFSPHIGEKGRSSIDRNNVNGFEV